MHFNIVKKRLTLFEGATKDERQTMEKRDTAVKMGGRKYGVQKSAGTPEPALN